MILAPFGACRDYTECCSATAKSVTVMYPVSSPAQFGPKHNEIIVLGTSRRSDSSNSSEKTKPNNQSKIPIDEVRLSSAVRKILASAAGVVSSQSATLLASKVASADPALATQAFGRIMSAVSFGLLSPIDKATSDDTKHAQGSQGQDKIDTPPNLTDTEEPTKSASTEVSLHPN